jgi:Flp pilus assembly protein TadG
VRTTQGRAPAGGRGHERGQALLELALVTPILALLLMAIFQFAFVLETQMGLTNAVREAARRAAADPCPTTDGVMAELTGSGGLLEQNVQGYTATRLWGSDPGDGSQYQVSPSVTWSSYMVGTTTNYRVTVYVAYKNPVFFPLLSYATSLVDGAPNDTWDLAAEASMRLESPKAPPALGGSCP